MRVVTHAQNRVVVIQTYCSCYDEELHFSRIGRPIEKEYLKDGDSLREAHLKEENKRL